jgi:predicted RNA-binding protein with PIN domain
MPYIIDGHNLIPKLPGFSLSDADDEQKLIDLLLEFARVKQSTLEVYFDKAPAGFANTRQLGRVKAVFVSEKTIADTRIMSRIKSLGNSARNWVVVTSDRRIIADAKAAHAGALSSDIFAKQIMATLDSKGDNPSQSREMTPEELDNWLKLFEKRN